MNRSFEVFNADGTKNREVTQYALLEVNRHKEQINVVVTDLNDTDMFLEYNWLVKYNLEVNWNTETIQFTRCPRNYRICSGTIQPTDNQDKGQQEIGKEPNPMNSENLPKYI